MTILEDLKAGRLVVVPREALADLCNAVMADISEAKRRLDADIPKDAPVHPVSAFLTGTALHIGKARASPDHTTALVEMIEGMERERDAQSQTATRYANELSETRAGAIEANGLKGMWMDRALAAEAKRDALREALGRLDRLFTYPVAAEINPRGYGIRADNADGVEFAVEIIRRALTQEQPNVRE